MDGLERGDNSWWSGSTVASTSTADCPSLGEIANLIKSIPKAPPPFSMRDPMMIVPEHMDPEWVRERLVEFARGLPEWDRMTVQSMPIKTYKNSPMEDDKVFFFDRYIPPLDLQIKFMELPAPVIPGRVQAIRKQIRRLENFRLRGTLGERGCARLSRISRRLLRIDELGTVVWEHRRLRKRWLQSVSPSYSYLSLGA